VDETSQVFIARDGSGVAHRIVVTPSSRIADMGNLIFDVEGNYLGDDTGSEVPWDDEDFMAGERARVAALMDGSSVQGEATTTCAGR